MAEEDVPGNSEHIASNVLDITMFDDFGNQITELQYPLTICIANKRNKRSEVCLGFFNEDSQRWENEDCSLTLMSEPTRMHCGETGKYMCSLFTVSYSKSQII